MNRNVKAWLFLAFLGFCVASVVFVTRVQPVKYLAKRALFGGVAKRSLPRGRASTEISRLFAEWRAADPAGKVKIEESARLAYDRLSKTAAADELVFLNGCRDGKINMEGFK